MKKNASHFKGKSYIGLTNAEALNKKHWWYKNLVSTSSSAFNGK